MSSNFLDKTGICFGGDWHIYYAAGAGPAPVPKPLSAHIVFCAHFSASRAWRIAHSVTTDGSAVLQNNWAMLLVPHIPAPPPGPPHPAAEGANLAAIILASSSSPQLSAHSVTGQGQALLTSIVACVGANLDCSDLPAPGGMLDINLNTVKTTPTLGDYIAAYVGAILNQWYAWAGSVLAGTITGVGPLQPILWQSAVTVLMAIQQNLLDAANADPVVIVIGWITGKIQALVDSVACPSAPALGA